MTDSLVLKVPFNEDMDDVSVKVIATVCYHLQKEYDISPQILESSLNSHDFILNCKFLYEQYLGEMRINLTIFKSTSKSQNDSFQTEEQEKCGYLIASHCNGYISYCNHHRYLHPNPQLSSRLSDGICDHQFVVKTREQIVKERYQSMILLIYQSFVNKLYHMIHLMLLETLIESCQMAIVPLSDQTMGTLIDQMKKNPNIFKSRTIYELPNQQNQQDLSKKYYLKVYYWSPSKENNDIG